MVTWVKSARSHGYGYGPYGYRPYGKIWIEWTKPNYYWDEELPYSADLSDDDIYLSNQYIYLVNQNIWKTTWTKEW